MGGGRWEVGGGLRLIYLHVYSRKYLFLNVTINIASYTPVESQPVGNGVPKPLVS